jgi:hypothetical protein
VTAILDGSSRLILHLGYPTRSFRAPLIYNPYFESIGLKAAVVPMGVKAEDFGAVFPALCRITNFLGALITMPHKVSIVPMLDEVSDAVRIAHACNAVLRRADGAERLWCWVAAGWAPPSRLRSHGMECPDCASMIVIRPWRKSSRSGFSNFTRASAS